MSQLNWIFLDDFGRKFKVGLYHGDQSGHLMVFCNSRVLLIDFHVLQSKKYSFYLGDELCDLILERKDGKFQYGLKPDKNADTPLNRLRKHQTRKHWIQSAVLGGLVLFSIAILSWLIYAVY